MVYHRLLAVDNGDPTEIVAVLHMSARYLRFPIFFVTGIGIRSGAVIGLLLGYGV